jgi:hypothetical protein
MCIICIDLVRGLVTPKDALRNMVENIDEIGDEHAKKVLELISIKESEEAAIAAESEEEDEEAPIFSST